jgi:hypothetical protein
MNSGMMQNTYYLSGANVLFFFLSKRKVPKENDTQNNRSAHKACARPPLRQSSGQAAFGQPDFFSVFDKYCKKL